MAAKGNISRSGGIESRRGNHPGDKTYDVGHENAKVSMQFGMMQEQFAVTGRE